MPRSISKSAQFVLNVLFTECGFSAGPAARAVGITFITAKKYRQKLLNDGQLTEIDLPKDSLLRLAFRAWRKYESPSASGIAEADREQAFDVGTVLSRTIVTPYINGLIEETRHWAFLFEPETKEDALWWTLFDKRQLDDFIRWTVIDQIKEKNVCDPVKIRAKLESGFRSGQNLPCWPARRLLLANALQSLPFVERRVIDLSYGLGGNEHLEDKLIAQELKLKKSQISWRRNKAIVKLKVQILKGRDLEGLEGTTSWGAVIAHSERRRQVVVQTTAELHRYRSQVAELQQLIASNPVGFQLTKDSGLAQSPLLLTTRIEDMDFSIRTHNCLIRDKIETLGELIKCRPSELMAIRNFGFRSLREIYDKLEGSGLTLAADPEQEIEEDDFSLVDEEDDLLGI